MATGRRRGRAIIYVALILILLLVLVAALANRGGGLRIPFLTREEPQTAVPAAEPTQAVDTVDIVVTTQNVLRGQELTEGLIQLIAIPREDYTEGVFYTSLEEVVGSRAKYDLEAHTPLTSALVVPPGASGSIPAFDIPKGMVAISVPVSQLSSVSFGLQKGDHVNVIVSLLMLDLDTSFQSELPNRTGLVIAPGPIDETQTNVTATLDSGPEFSASGGGAYSYLGRIEIDPTMNNPVYLVQSESQRPRLVSQTLIQDVVVLQMGDFPEVVTVDVTTDQTGEETTPQEPTTREQQQQEEGEQAAPAAPSVITLIVSPQDAVTLNYLMLAGANLNLVMRSAGDDQKIDTEAVTLQFVLDQYRITNPAKLPYGLEPRINNFSNTVPAFPDPGFWPTPQPPSEQ